MTHCERQGFGFVSLLLTVAILSLVYYFVLTRYISRPAIDEPTQKILAEQGIDTSTQQSILNSAVSEIKRLEKLNLDRAEKMDIYHLPEH